MAEITLAQLEEADKKRAEYKAAGDKKFADVSFFKLADGDKALVRFNIADLNQEKAIVTHSPIYGKSYVGGRSTFSAIECVNEYDNFGRPTTDQCPFCKAAAAKHEVIGAAKSKIFIKMLVSYQDKQTGGWMKPVACVWERPIGFRKELKELVATYGQLNESLFIITRDGVKTDTRYLINYAPDKVFKPELIPADFSEFEIYHVNKHAYRQVDVDAMESFVSTGTFEGTSYAKSSNVNAAQATSAPAQTMDVSDDLSFTEEVCEEPADPTPVQTAAPAKKASKFAF